MSGARPERTTGLWVGLAFGLPMVAFGIVGVFEDAARTRPASLLGWVVGSAVVHDLVLAPLAFAVGWGVMVATRGRPYWWVRWALATSAVLVLFSWPLIRGYGRNPTVPSLLPRDYTAGLALYVGGVWLLALVMTVAARRWTARVDRTHRQP